MKQASAIVTLSVVGFAIALAAFISSRLSEQAVALLAGTICGMMLALPIGAAIGWFAKGHQRPDRALEASSPTVIVTPQPPSFSGQMWRAMYPTGSNTPQLAPRKFTIGGEEIITHEPDAVW